MGDRILIVDDDEALRENLQLVLAAEEFEVQAAASGEDALKQIESYSAEIVFCDLRMLHTVVPNRAEVPRFMRVKFLFL